jgi:hypothetical protein
MHADAIPHNEGHDQRRTDSNYYVVDLDAERVVDGPFPSRRSAVGAANELAAGLVACRGPAAVALDHSYRGGGA